MSPTRSASFTVASPLFVLTVILVFLKAFGLFPFGWLWVFTPLWIGPALALAVVAATFAVGLTVVVGAGLFLGVWWLIFGWRESRCQQRYSL